MLSSLFVFALTGLNIVSGVAVPSERRATVCNGNAALCSRLYSNVTYVGSHDSYAVDSSSLDLSANQGVSVTQQLNDGVRMLQSQAHLDGSTLNLCHTSGTLLSYLTTVVTWLAANPNEVLTLLITNGDAISISEYWVPAFQSSGIIPYLYVPSSTSPGRSGWPTLGSMISSGKRVVVFMDYNTDTTAAPYILPEFNSIWEPPYDVTDSTFPCSVDRGTAANNMLMLNHFLDKDVLSVDIPARSSASTTNSQTSIVANANGCLSLNTGYNPTFVLLDFVDQGQAFAAASHLNGLS